MPESGAKRLLGRRFRDLEELESTGRDGRDSAELPDRLPESTAGPGIPRDLVDLGQGALVHRS